MNDEKSVVCAIKRIFFARKYRMTQIYFFIRIILVEKTIIDGVELESARKEKAK